MHGVIHSYKRGKHRLSTNQMIVVVDGVESKEQAAALVGKKVVYHTGSKDLMGEVRAAHGNSGALRVLFETGMPGQALGHQVTIQ